MNVNKNGIAVQTPRKPKVRKRPDFQLNKIQMANEKEVIMVPEFKPLQEVLTAYGWELREVQTEGAYTT